MIQSQSVSGLRPPAFSEAARAPQREPSLARSSGRSHRPLLHAINKAVVESKSKDRVLRTCLHRGLPATVSPKSRLPFNVELYLARRSCFSKLVHGMRFISHGLSLKSESKLLTVSRGEHQVLSIGRALCRPCAFSPGAQASVGTFSTITVRTARESTSLRDGLKNETFTFKALGLAAAALALHLHEQHHRNLQRHRATHERPP